MENARSKISFISARTIRALPTVSTSNERGRQAYEIAVSQGEILRTFALIVSAHPYCARNSHLTSRMDRALSGTVNNNRANGHCYSFA